MTNRTNKLQHILTKSLSFFALIMVFWLILVADANATIRWNFTSSVEGWVGRNGTVVQHSTDDGGRLSIYNYGNDPGMVRHNLSINASSNNLVKMRVATYCSNLNGTLYFKRSGSSATYYGGTVNLSNGTNWGIYEIDVSNNANWYGTITELRIDPSDICGSSSSSGFIGVDWIEVVAIPVLPPPTLISPINNTTVTSVTLRWQQVSSATGYQLDVDGNLVNINSGSQTSYSPTLNYGNHRWRARTKNSSNVYGNWSGYQYFTRENRPPIVSFTLHRYTITHGWEVNLTVASHDPDGDSYSTKWRVNSGSWNNAPNNGITVIPASSFILGQNTVYVRATDNYGLYGQTSRIVTDYAYPASPTLYSPTDYFIKKNLTPHSFDWSTVIDADRYRIYVDNNSGFGSPEISPEPTSSQLTSNTNLPNNVYYWKVQARNPAGTWGGWSITRMFVVDTSPPAPFISSPSNGSQFNEGSTVTFNWSGPNGYDIARYYLRIVEGTNLNDSPIYSEELFSTSRLVNLSGWNTGTHIWGVRAIKDAPPGFNQSQYETAIGWGAYATRTFTVNLLNGSISGGVRDDITYIGIGGATVQLKQGSSVKYTKTSDPNGVYSIPNVVPGTYTLVGIKSGYNTWSQLKTIDPGQNLTVQNIAMVPLCLPGTPLPNKNMGVLAKTCGDPKIYWIKYSKKWHILNNDIFTGLAYPADAVEEYVTGALDSFAEGKDILSDNDDFLYRKQDNSTVYLIRNGKSDWFLNYQVFLDYGFTDEDVYWPNDQGFSWIQSIYPPGEVITPLPQLTVTHPNGGETLTKGTEYQITWNSTNITGNVQIDLYKGGTAPANFIIQLAADDPNDESYPFNPPDYLTDGTDYKIGISSKNEPVSDFSDGYFIIVPPSLPPGPSLISPTNNSTVSNTKNLIFQWSTVVGAVGYEIEGDNDCGFNSPEINNFYVNGGTNTSQTFENHLSDNTYCWKVKAKFGTDNYSDWSQTWQVTYQLPVYEIPFWVPLYRLYDSTRKDHYYTTRPNHRDDHENDGYTYERIEGYISDRKFDDASTAFRK